MPPAPEAPALFVHWERFVGWLLGRTAKFPRHTRLTFAARIDGIALDVFERIVEARYDRDRMPLLVRMNLDLEKLRLLLRLARDGGILDPRAFGHAVAEIDTAGRMVGGWIRHTRGRPE